MSGRRRTQSSFDPDEDYGPHREAARRLAGRTMTLTGRQKNDLAQAWQASDAAVWSEATSRAWSAAAAANRAVDLSIPRVAGVDNVWRDPFDPAHPTARCAATDALTALHTRDLIGTVNGWDQAAYDALTRPWVAVVGNVHPDDAQGSGQDA